MLPTRRARRLALLAATPLIATLLVASGTAAEPAPPAHSEAPAAAAIGNVGPGSQPGVAVDAAGTAYIAWNGPEQPSTLRFCKYPRGGSACTLTTTIATLGNSLTRPFVTVNGSTVRIVSYRYPLGSEVVAGSYLYTSTDGGSTFGPGLRVGSVPFFEAVPGPGDTMSGVTDAISTGMVFQNVPLGGGSAGDTAALLSLPDDSPYRGGVGMVDAATPLAVFTNGFDAAKFRRYTGSGSINDAANWTPAAPTGTAAYPKLAGGPTGLFMMAGNGLGKLFVRKYNGTAFSAPVSMGPGSAPNHHIFQDAAGRLHAVWELSDASGLHLIHAASDDGVSWRAGAAAFQNPGVAGAFNSLRVAVAPDHVGVAVWQASTAGIIRIVAVGPDAPLSRPGLTLSGNAKHVGNKVEVTASGKLVLPPGVTPANGCEGSVKVTIKKAARVLDSKTVAVNSQCKFRAEQKVGQGEVGGADQLKLVAKFNGNFTLASKTTSRTVRVRG